MTGEFVGREWELAALAHYLDDALAGGPSVVLCRGEPGTGMTRLAEELAGLARKRDVSVPWGLCVEGAPPYFPRRQVLRAMAEVTAVSAVADEHGLSGDLAGLIPGRPALPEDVEALLRLRLLHIRRHVPEVVASAKAQRWEPVEVLRALLGRGGHRAGTIRARDPTSSSRVPHREDLRGLDSRGVLDPHPHPTSTADPGVDRSSRPWVSG